MVGKRQKRQETRHNSYRYPNSCCKAGWIKDVTFGNRVLDGNTNSLVKIFNFVICHHFLEQSDVLLLNLMLTDMSEGGILRERKGGTWAEVVSWEREKVGHVSLGEPGSRIRSDLGIRYLV